MWASDKEHLQYLANEISELEEHLMNAKFYGWIGGFFAYWFHSPYVSTS